MGDVEGSPTWIGLQGQTRGRCGGCWRGGWGGGGGHDTYIAVISVILCSVRL